MSVRLGAVAYLNARPLTLALEGSTDPFVVEYSVPSRCAAKLHAGDVELGLIPSIEFARGEVSYQIVPEVAIATRSRVYTVRLFWKGEFAQIRRVALDTSSRTSVALTRILMRERFQLDPEFVEAKPDLEKMLERADAALLIGDAVFGVDEAGYDSVDLGEEWIALTGYPFVFAFWAGHPDSLGGPQVERLIRACDEGRRRIPEIAGSFCNSRSDLGHSPSFYERYLTENICFEMGADELKGLATFYRLAHRHGLIEPVPELRFYERVPSPEVAGRTLACDQ